MSIFRSVAGFICVDRFKELPVSSEGYNGFDFTFSRSYYNFNEILNSTDRSEKHLNGFVTTEGLKDRFRYKCCYFLSPQ